MIQLIASVCTGFPDDNGQQVSQEVTSFRQYMGDMSQLHLVNQVHEQL